MALTDGRTVDRNLSERERERASVEAALVDSVFKVRARD